MDCYVSVILDTLSGGDETWEEQFLRAGVTLTNALDWLNAAMLDVNSARAELNRLLEEREKAHSGE